MKISRMAGNKGLIKIILIIVVLILVVSYFGINIRALVSSPTTQDNISYVSSSTVTIWNSYLKVPATYVWNLFVNLIWNTAIDSLKNGSFQVPSLTPSTTPSI